MSVLPDSEPSAKKVGFRRQLAFVSSRSSVSDSSMSAKAHAAREALDKQVREVVQWHFSPETGTPFWLEKAKTYKFNPLKDVQGFADLKQFPLFEDDWLRASPDTDISQWIPRA